MKKARVGYLLAAIVLLSGCSEERAREDAEQAADSLRRQIVRQQRASVAWMAGDSLRAPPEDDGERAGGGRTCGGGRFGAFERQGPGEFQILTVWALSVAGGCVSQETRRRPGGIRPETPWLSRTGSAGRRSVPSTAGVLQDGLRG